MISDIIQCSTQLKKDIKDPELREWVKLLSEGSALIFAESKSPIVTTLNLCLWIGENSLTIMMSKDEIKSYTSILTSLSE